MSFMLIPDTPSDYDNAYIAVTPVNMDDASTAILAAATDISNDLIDIYNSLNSLRLSWVGQASDAATELNTLWTNVVNTLFGATGSEGPPGALNVLVQSVGQLASTYAGNEQAITGMFNAMYTSITGANQNGPATQPDTSDALPHLVVGTQVPSTNYTPVTDDGTDAPYYSTSVNET
jgi:hypothetical protein